MARASCPRFYWHITQALSRSRTIVLQVFIRFPRIAKSARSHAFTSRTIGRPPAGHGCPSCPTSKCLITRSSCACSSRLSRRSSWNQTSLDRRIRLASATAANAPRIIKPSSSHESSSDEYCSVTARDSICSRLPFNSTSVLRASPRKIAVLNGKLHQ